MAETLLLGRIGPPVNYDWWLRRIGDVLPTLEDRGRTSDLEKMERAAVILGSIEGYRSFRMVAGLSSESYALTRVLTSGATAIAATAGAAR